MSKSQIQQKFQVGNELYSLVYFPDKEDVTQCEPNYKLMHPVAADVTEVFFPDGRGGTSKKYMSWLRTIIPANQATMTPQKNFLLFALLDSNVPVDYIQQSSLICYAVQDLSQNNTNIQQQVINKLFNVVEESAPKQKIDESWASSLFEKAPASEYAEEVATDVITSTEAEA